MTKFKWSFIYASALIMMILFLQTCGKQVESAQPSEKMPITTQSTLALQEYQLGKELSDKLQHRKAALHYRAALQADPAFPMAWVRLATVSGGTEDFVAALDSAKSYAQLASEAEQRIIRSFDFALQGNSTAQKKELDDLVKEYPGDEEAHLLRGNLFFGLQEYRQAIQCYSRAVEINPRLAISYNQLGYSQRALGNYGEAEKAFKQYIALTPKNPNAFDSYAELLLEMGRYPESIEYYQQALGLDSCFISSHIGIACDYSFLGQHARAREQLAYSRQVAQSDVDLRRAIFAEATTHVCEGNLPAAIEVIQVNLKASMAAEDVSNMANDLVVLGNLFLEMGETEEALELFNRSLQVVNESDLQTAIITNARILHFYNVARVFSAQGDTGRAQKMAQAFQAEVESRKNPVQMRLAHRLFAIIALDQGQYENAIAEFEQADPMNPYNLYRIGLAYEGLGNMQMAEAMKQRAAELNVFNSLDQALVLSKTRFKS